MANGREPPQLGILAGDYRLQRRAECQGCSRGSTEKIIKRDVDAPYGLLEHRRVIVCRIGVGYPWHAIKWGRRDLFQVIVFMPDLLLRGLSFQHAEVRIDIASISRYRIDTPP